MKTVQSAFKFHGGVHPQYNKDLAASKPIEAMPLPKQLVVSMSQHLGAATPLPKDSSSASATASSPRTSTPPWPAPWRPSSRAWAPPAAGLTP